MSSKWAVIALLATFFSLPGCTDPQPPDGNGNNNGGNDNGGDEIPDPDPPALFEADVPAFAVMATSDRASGAPQTAFKLSASVAANASPVSSFSWTVNDEPMSTESSPEFVFDQPGDYRVQVVIEDEQGAVADDGILLKVFDPAATPTNTTSQIAPSAGRPATFVQIKSPALDDAGAFIQITVGDGAPFEPFRPELGVANFLIPLDAANDLTAATSLQIAILADGQQAGSFDFTLSPAAALNEPPGTITTRWLQAGPDLIDRAEDDLVALLSGLDAGLLPEEQALAQALLRFSKARFGQVRDALLPLIDELDAATLTTLDQALIANGVSLADLDGLSVQPKRSGLAKNENDDVIDRICQYHQVMDAIRGFIAGAGQAAALLPALGFGLAGSAITPTLLAMDKIAAELGVIDDILEGLDEIVPRVQDELFVSAVPAALRQDDDKAVVQVTASLVTRVDICSQTLENLIEFLTNKALSSILNSVPFPRAALIVTRHSFVFGEVARVTTLQEMQSFLADVIRNLINATFTTPAINTLFIPLKDRLCRLDNRDTLKLQPEEMLFTQDPSGGGRFLNLQDESIDFFCNPNTQGPVKLEVERECGLTDANGNVRKLTGETQIVCGGEECTDDASGSIVVEVLVTNQFDVPATCMNLSDVLVRRDATITVTNTHPDRTIKIAAVSYIESDQQDLTRGPCEGDNLLPGESVQDCLESRVAGCDHALSGPTVGFSGFLQPGEKSLAVPYICSNEFTFPDVGPCGDREIETRTTNWVIQAVFCDNIENAEANFCSVVDPSMKEFGLPGLSQIWIPMERKGCQ